MHRPAVSWGSAFARSSPPTLKREKTRELAWDPIRTLRREKLPLWWWGQGAWGLLIAYLGGGEGHVLEEAVGVREGCFSFGVKGCAARFTAVQGQGCVYIIVN